ncbi:MAG TPA: EamA family transporter [Terriglobales bacterium]|nr:EamA family transporter [Terriglobales bacterium]
MSPTAKSASSASGARVWSAFALVYVFWGSTYLAISIAVRTIPPAMLCATRFLISGPLMLAWCAVSGHRIRIGAQDAWRLGVIGVLLLSGGNAMVAWSEQYTPSGISALIVASVPLWIMLLERLMGDSERLSPRGIAGLLCGIFGIVLLLWPKLATASTLGHRELIGAGGLLFASASWALGSLFSHRWCKPSRTPGAQAGGIADSLSASAWQMIFAGAFNLLLAVIFGQPQRAHWTAQGFGAIIYLVIFGSWVGYTAYIWLLKHVPTSKVATYAYVNPIIAVLLGWAILGEQVNRYVAAGSIVIVASVVLVNTAQVRDSRSAQGPDEGAQGALGDANLPTCEPSAD